MDLDEARQAASQATEQQKNNNASLQDEAGETFEFYAKIKQDFYHGIQIDI